MSSMLWFVVRQELWLMLADDETLHAVVCHLGRNDSDSTIRCTATVWTEKTKHGGMLQKVSYNL